MDSDSIVLLVHLYYKHTPEELRQLISLPKEMNITIVFNLLNEHQHQNKTAITDYQNNSGHQVFIIETPNIGKDIGGKLALVDLCLQLNIKANYYILLHDKKSPHTLLGDIWREKLFRIIEPQNIEKIKRMFDEDSKLGIVAAKEFVMNEYNNSTGNFNCTSNQIIKKLILQYKLNLSNFDFVGGTMFWIKAEIFNAFFLKHNALEIRATLEKGNVLDHEHGSNTHAWERMLSWIAIDQGYKIKGI